MTPYRSGSFEGSPDDYDVLQIIEYTDPRGNQFKVKVLVSDTVENGAVEPIMGLTDGDVAFYLLIHPAMVTTIRKLGYFEMLNRALTLMAMEISEQLVDGSD